MAKRGRGGMGAPEGGSKNKKKRQTQQNGSAREQKEDNDHTPPTTSPAGAEAAATATAAVGKTKTLDKGKGKGGRNEKPAARQEKLDDKEDAMAGDRAAGKGVGSSSTPNSSRRRRKKVHEEVGYEGPVQEESDSERSSAGGDGSSDDDSDDDSDDEIKLDGAMTRRSDAEEDDEEGDEEEEEEGGEGETGGGAGAASAAEAGDQQTVVDVCLDFCDPHERFFHGIRALVGHSYLQDAAGAGLSPLVDLAVAQGAVGTVLSTDAEGDAVFGFVTALPLRHLSRDNECVQAVIKYLLDKASKAGRGPEMEEVLGESAQGKVGLLVSERMINCPMQAVPKLHEALVEDIAWAIDNEISEEHRDKFRFDKFVVVAPCDDAGGAGSGPAMLSDFYFSRFDDEVLLQEADFFFPMSCASQSAGGGGGSASGGGGGPQQRYVVGVMPASKLGECAQGIAQMVG